MDNPDNSIKPLSVPSPQPSGACLEIDPVICFCSGTKRGQIKALFLQGESLEAISQRTGALSGCGGCEWDITGFLLELTAEQYLSVVKDQPEQYPQE